MRRLSVSLLLLVLALLLLAAVLPRSLGAARYDGEMAVAKAFAAIEAAEAQYHSEHARYATLDELGLRGIAEKDGFKFALELTPGGYSASATPSVFRWLLGTRTYHWQWPVRLQFYEEIASSGTTQKMRGR